MTIWKRDIDFFAEKCPDIDLWAIGLEFTQSYCDQFALSPCADYLISSLGMWHNAYIANSDISAQMADS